MNASPSNDFRPRADDDSGTFWDRIYRARTRPPSGQPNSILAELAARLVPGRALDLGCALGDDALWLARAGWHVTAVDVSDDAVRRVRARAAEAGVGARVDAQRHDLAATFPPGAADLVYALFLQSPVDFPREQVLRRAAAAVAPGGRLLVATHGSTRPWAWRSDADVRYPTPEEQLAALELTPERWSIEVSDAPERQVTGPGGEVATVVDIVTVAHRRP